MSASACEEQGAGWGSLDELPGEPMIWVLILSELAAFGLFLGAFVIARAIHPDRFTAGQAELDSSLAGLNTLVLVTSGWAAARATKSAQACSRSSARRWILIAMGLGGCFIAIKLFEYAGEIGRGIGLETSTFFTLYFLLTGFHLLHVCLGIVILAVVCRRAESYGVETGTARPLLANALVLGLAAIKGRRIALDFLDLRAAPALWRGLVSAWIVVLVLFAWLASAVIALI